MNTLHFRPATTADANRIYAIILQAKARMKARGTLQWQDGYPTPGDIVRDIARGAGWVLSDTEKVIAYGAAIFDGEPAYLRIDGCWLSEGPYVVVHRLAVADEAIDRGVATEFMRCVENLARKQGVGSFRVDTNFDNPHMLHLLPKIGFIRCGEIMYGGGKRIAFEKLLGRSK